MFLCRTVSRFEAMTTRTSSAKHGANATTSGANAKPASQTTEASVLLEMQQSLKKATEEMGKVGQLLTTLQEEVNEVKEANKELRNDVDQIMLRLDEAESRISQLEDENVKLCTSAEKSAKKCEELHQAIEDAANRDRRQNLRLIGLKEKSEGGKLDECVRQIISEALGVELDRTQLQRVHRTAGPVPDEDRPPRPIVMRFLSFLERERVLDAAREKYKKKEVIVWRGCRLSFFPDMTRETAEKRKKFTDARRRLHELDVRFTLAYPAELRFTWEGKRMRFTDHRKALAFLSNTQNEEEEHQE